MPHRWRRIVVGVVVVCGILLLILGIYGLRELMVVGQAQSESLGRRVGYTTVALFFGLVSIVWCLVAGRNWARGVRSEMAGDASRSADQK